MKPTEKMTEEARAAIKLAQAEPLADKIRKAIDFLQFNEVLHGGAGYYLAFSGGKDSIVIKALAQMAGVKHDCFYNQTTIDPPELVRFIQKEHADVTWIRPSKPLPFAMADSANGPPTRISRWCCKVYKEGGGQGRVKILGVRAAESPRRAKRWSLIVPNRTGGTILCPIVYWTDEDIWDFIRHFHLPYPSLYDEGFTRLGCVGCPQGGRKGQLRDFARWPGFERLWKKGFQMFWEKYSNTPTRQGVQRSMNRDFNSWEEHWNWWISSKGVQTWKEECQMAGLFAQNEEDSEEPVALSEKNGVE